MAPTKRKKDTRMRGSHTHGGGHKKKRRGAGSRGGRGMAGSGKRADVKKPSSEKIKGYFGKHGFSSKSRTAKNPLTTKTLSSSIQTWTTKGKAEEKGGVFSVDLSSLHYTKLIAAGPVSFKINVTVGMASQKAIEAIEKAGGKVTLTEQALKAKESSAPEKETAEKKTPDQESDS
ncbi:MAG: uL15 family ribosomal protein [archaeon]